jgi:DNA-binding SARP family transcriptional activator
MSSASLTLLGGFDARLDSGASLALPTHKYKALLAFLGVPAGQMHPRDRLVALLWGDRTHDQGRTALRQGLWVLRKALNTTTSAGLIIDGDLIGIDASAVHVDVAEFERAAATGMPEDLERAAALYRGEFLAGLAARETPFEEWLTVERERLGELALQSLARLLAHRRRTGTLEAAAQTALRLLALDPLEQSVHRALIQIYMDLGRRGAALRQYQTCVGILQRELGAEPDAETRALYRSIVSERGVTPVKRAPRTSALESSARAASPEMAAPLIGRTLERTLLREALDEAVAGRSQIVLVLGEAGMGKTRLVEAVRADAAERGARVMVGHCFDAEQVLPYGPWTDALRRADLASDVDMLATLPAMSRAALGRFVPELVPTDIARDPAATDHMLVFDSVARLVEALTVRRPLVLIIEDAHWADDISLRLMSFLVRRLDRASPVLVAITARAEEVADAPVLQRFLDDLDRDNALLQISLTPLDRGETERLIAALGGSRDSAVLARLNDSIWAASEGSPFMVVETLHALRDGADTDAQGQLPLPERVRRIVARRLERLSAPARQLAATAAVIGRDFGFDLLHRASGLGVNEAIDAVEELVRRHIFVEAGDGFDFSHARIREVARGALLTPRRRILHRQVAETLEALHSEAVDVDAAVLGHHYREAEVWDRALSYLRQAGAQAMVRGAVREAAIMLAQAVEAQELLPAGRVRAEDVFDLRVSASRPLYGSGDLVGFGKRVEEIQALANQLGDRARLAVAYIHACEYLRAEHEHDHAREAGEAGLGLAIEVRNQALQDQAHFQLGCVYAWQGDPERALRHLEVATAAAPCVGSGAPIGLLNPYLPALGGRITALAELGRFAEAWPLAAQAILLVEAGAQPAAFPLARIGGLCVIQGRLEEAIAHLVHSLDIQRERGFAVARASGTAFLAEAYALAGRRTDAIAILEGTADWAASMPRPSQRSSVLTCLGRVHLLVDRFAEARRFGARALELAMSYGELAVEADARRLLAELALSEATSSAVDAADDELRHALDIARMRALRPLSAHCHVGLARISQRRDKYDDAREHLGTAITMYREMEMPYWVRRAEEVMNGLS